MKLPRVCISDKARKIYFLKTGFTLVEILVTLGIIFILLMASLPLFLNFYRNREINISEKNVVQALRRAQFKSMSGEDDISFGVRISSENHTLFKGTSYDARQEAYDEFFDFPDNLVATGISEVVFSKLKGVPSVEGTITLTIGPKQEIITINQIGSIDY